MTEAETTRSMPASRARVSARGLLRKAGLLAAGTVLAALVAVFALKTAIAWKGTAEITIDRLDGRQTGLKVEDYIAFYSAAKLVREGRGEDIYDVDAIGAVQREALGRDTVGVRESEALPYFNPPFVAVLMVPITFFRPTSAAMVLGAAALAALLTLPVLFASLREVDRRVVLAGSLFLLTSTPAAVTVAHGQFSTIIGAGCVLGVVLLQRAKDVAAGASLTVLLLKPQLAVLPGAGLGAGCRWLAFAALAAAAAVLVVVSLVASGWAMLVEYPRFLVESTSWDSDLGIYAHRMYGLSGFLAGLSENGSTVHLALSASCSAGVVTATAWVIRRFSPDLAISASLIIMATLLVNPHLYLYDFVLLTVAMVLAASRTRELDLFAVGWLALALANWYAQAFAVQFLDSYSLNLVTPVLAITWAYALVNAARNPPGRDTPTAAPRRATATTAA